MKEKYHKIGLLVQRIKRNYDEYKAAVLALECDYIFEYAAEIAVVNEVYSFIENGGSFTPCQADFLLNFGNPLMFLTEEWLGYTIDKNSDFEDFTEELTERLIERCNTGGFTTLEILRDLRDQYGGEMLTDTACLLELVKIGRRLLERGGIWDDDDDDIDDDFDDNFGDICFEDENEQCEGVGFCPDYE